MLALDESHLSNRQEVSQQLYHQLRPLLKKEDKAQSALCRRAYSAPQHVAFPPPSSHLVIVVTVEPCEQHNQCAITAQAKTHVPYLS